MPRTVFSDIHHIALVVHNADKTSAYWESLGLGPWEDYPAMTQYTEVIGLNADDFYDIKFKVLNLGKIYVQLCEPGEGDSPQRRFLDAKGEGVFHISFTVPDITEADECAKAVQTRGLMSCIHTPRLHRLLHHRNAAKKCSMHGPRVCVILKTKKHCIFIQGKITAKTSA